MSRKQDKLSTPRVPMNYLRAYCKKSTWLNGELEWQKKIVPNMLIAATYTWFIRSARAYKQKKQFCLLD